MFAKASLSQKDPVAVYQVKLFGIHVDTLTLLPEKTLRENLFGGVVSKSEANVRHPFTPWTMSLSLVFVITTIRNYWTGIHFSLIITDVYSDYGIPFVRVPGFRGSVNIIDPLGHSYAINSKQEEYKEVKHYRCSKRTVLKCKASVKIKGDFIIMLRNEHNHSPPEK